MRVLYYECFAGIAGDMNLGAMLDLGIEEEYLRSELSKLGIDDEFELSVNASQKNGITGVKVDVTPIKTEQYSSGEHHQSHEHTDDDHCLHSRNYFDIKKIINESALSECVKKQSLTMFSKVAHAEAKVHGIPVEEVHFHELGAVDSIVDMVGAAICIDKLAVDEVIASTVEVGRGFVNCAHGKIPVPAPAAAEILSGIKIHYGGVIGEATTPTGAAILSTLCSRFDDNPELTVLKVGYGVGSRDFEIPNLLRVTLGETEVAEKPIFKRVFSKRLNLIETNIDDMNPELFVPLVEKLWSLDVLDCYQTPIIMKKGRAGTTLSVLVELDKRDLVTELILRDSTTLGVRIFELDRLSLERRNQVVKTKYGMVSVKEALLDGEVIKVKPEFEELKISAEKINVPINDIQEEVLRVYRKRE